MKPVMIAGLAAAARHTIQVERMKTMLESMNTDELEADLALGWRPDCATGAGR